MQRSIARGQRGWNGQPLRPVEQRRRQPGDALERLLARRGTAGWRSAAGVGVQRLAKELARRCPTSTRSPAYMTPTRSTTCAISPMSCPIRMTAAPRSACTLSQRLHHLALDDDVERAGRLVGDDHLGPQADGDGDADALLHAAAQLVRDTCPRRSRRRPTLCEQLADPLVDARARTACTPWSRSASAIWSLHPHHRVERVHRALGDQRDLGQPASAASPPRRGRAGRRRRGAPGRPRSCPGGLIRRSRARAIVDLPEPDSPTRPSRSPACRSKLTPLTACTAPRGCSSALEGRAPGGCSSSTRAAVARDCQSDQGWLASS